MSNDIQKVIDQQAKLYAGINKTAQKWQGTSTIERGRKLLSTVLSGQDIAELEIEARRDAVELKDELANPYTTGSFESFCYIDQVRKEDGI